MQTRTGPSAHILRDGLDPDTAGLTIADLTGVGATDAAVAMAVYQATQ